MTVKVDSHPGDEETVLSQNNFVRFLYNPVLESLLRPYARPAFPDCAVEEEEEEGEDEEAQVKGGPGEEGGGGEEGGYYGSGGGGGAVADLARQLRRDAHGIYFDFHYLVDELVYFAMVHEGRSGNFALQLACLLFKITFSHWVFKAAIALAQGGHDPHHHHAHTLPEGLAAAVAAGLPRAAGRRLLPPTDAPSPHVAASPLANDDALGGTRAASTLAAGPAPLLLRDWVAPFDRYLSHFPASRLPLQPLFARRRAMEAAFPRAGAGVASRTAAGRRPLQRLLPPAPLLEGGGREEPV
uniref:Uncharacterized protein n=1 Tax=Heterosigma akashiwo TaxID=2829 RepID=A0A7S3XQE6_HETAK